MSFETGRAKWARKSGTMGANWKAGTSGKESELSEGIRRAGGNPGPQFLAAWREGVGATSAEEFQRKVAGKENKWYENTLRGISR